MNSLESPAKGKTLAKHTQASFFEKLIKNIARFLTDKGCCWLILPMDTSAEVKPLIKQNGMSLSKTINIHSYPHSEPHRVILCFGFEEVSCQRSKFIIYKAVGIYSEEYQKLLQPYFLAF